MIYSSFAIMLYKNQKPHNLLVVGLRLRWTCKFIESFQLLYYSALIGSFLYFLVLCWISSCVPLLFSFSSVSILWVFLKNFLSGKFLSFFFFLVIWNTFLCLLFLFDFLCLYEIRWNRNLFQSRRCVFLWEHPHAVCECPVTLTGELHLKQAWTILRGRGDRCLGRQ